MWIGGNWPYGTLKGVDFKGHIELQVLFQAPVYHFCLSVGLGMVGCRI